MLFNINVACTFKCKAYIIKFQIYKWNIEGKLSFYFTYTHSILFIAKYLNHGNNKISNEPYF